MIKPPIPPELEVLVRPRPTELVFGLIGGLGTDLDTVQASLAEALTEFGYETQAIRLSSTIKLFPRHIQPHDLTETPEPARVRAHMAAGTSIRSRIGHGGALAAKAAGEIAKARSEATSGKEPFEGRAWIINSLKHPEEVEVLQRIYGPGFFAIGIYASFDERKRFLIESKGFSNTDAVSLMERDEDEGDYFGQRARDAYPLADVFVRGSPQNWVTTKKELLRSLDVVFGHPYEAPSSDELGMYYAYAASRRSLSLSRQVGATILSPLGDVLSVGCNEVAAPNGGLYPQGKADQRDYVKGVDSNDAERRSIVKKIIEEAEKASSSLDSVAFERELRKTRLWDMTEYGRAVHAELEALLSCTRNGVSPRNSVLYTTTFPCHTCAKHIIGAGLAKVVFLEPYPKSRSLQLFRDELSERDGGQPGCVELSAFVGIGPRRFMDAFSMQWGPGRNLERKDEKAHIVRWTRANGCPRMPNPPQSYMDRELIVTRALVDIEKRTAQEAKV